MVRRTGLGFTLIELMIVIATIAVLAAIMIPNYVRARGLGHLSACCSNLRSIGTALEIYALDNRGRYPKDSLEVLTKARSPYINSIPVCPAVEGATYHYQSATNPDNYTIYCSGANHTNAALGPNLPAFDSVSGLMRSY